MSFDFFDYLRRTFARIVMRCLAFIIGLLSVGAAQAQLSPLCVDTTRINSFYSCAPLFFDPVCGCNAKTYTNECEAYYQAGVNTIEYSGVCQSELFYFDFWPNRVVVDFEFHLLVAQFKEVDATIQIFNSFGNRVYYKLLNNLTADYPYQETVVVSELQNGVYFIMVNTNGVYKINKFVKFKI